MSAPHALLVITCVVVAVLTAPMLTELVRRTVAARSVDDHPRPVGVATLAVATAIGFGAIAARFGATAQLPAYLFLVALLVVLSFVDLATKTLPRRLVQVGMAVGIVVLAPIGALGGQPARLLWATVGAVVAYFVLTALHLAARGGFGYGDVRLGAMLGWYLAWQGLRYVPLGLFLAFMLSALTGVALMAAGRVGRRTAIPFGPFLALGAIVALVATPVA